MATAIRATRQVVEDYQRLFVNGRAHTMCSRCGRTQNAGSTYYFRPSEKGIDIPLMLTDETIRRHLESWKARLLSGCMPDWVPS
jgi:hypothetical protein